MIKCIDLLVIFHKKFEPFSQVFKALKEMFSIAYKLYFEDILDYSNDS